jgi:hypothetical protein
MTTQIQHDLSDEDLWRILDGGSNRSSVVIADLPVPEALTDEDVAGIDTTSPATDVGDDDFDGDDSYFDDEVESQKTITTFASSPLARLGLVGTGALAVVVAIGAMVGGFSGSVEDAAKKQQEKGTQPTPFASPMVPPAQQSNGDLKAQMAFQTQQQAMQTQQAKPTDTKTATPPAPTIKPTPTPSPAPVPAPPPPTPVAVSPPPPIPEPVHIAPAPKPSPISPPVPVSPIPLANLPPIDPNKAWQDLSQSATYGSLPVMVTNTPPPAPAPIVTPAPKAQNPQSDMGGLPSLSSYQNVQSFNSAPRRKLRIGTQVKARLMNPIAWSGDGKDVAFSGNGAPTPKFIAKLEQPLNDSDGNQVVPEGAELVVAVRSLEPNSGMAELTALQLIIDNQEFAPPIGALTLRGANGNPLLADKFQDKGKDIAAADRAMFFFGALAKVGELLNRSDTSVVITANGSSSSSSSSSGNTNILGGVLQGGFGALAQQQQQRNQQWYQEILRRPDIRYIPAGKELSLYVNQTVIL